MEKPLVLFDIDWTLLKGGLSEHIDGFSYAWKKVLGIDAHVSDWRQHHGQPDVVLLLKIPILAHGLDAGFVRSKLEELKDAKIAYFFEHAQKEYSHLLMPGVVEFLEELERRKIPKVIASGNLEKIGWYRLESAGIKKYFISGGWGDGVPSKTESFQQAIANAEDILGEIFPRERIFDIGDSHYDAEAAKKAGIKSIGLATGFDTEDVLRKAGADVVLGSLTEKDTFFHSIGSVDSTPGS